MLSESSRLIGSHTDLRCLQLRRPSRLAPINFGRRRSANWIASRSRETSIFQEPTGRKSRRTEFSQKKAADVNQLTPSSPDGTLDYLL